MKISKKKWGVVQAAPEVGLGCDHKMVDWAITG